MVFYTGAILWLTKPVQIAKMGDFSILGFKRTPHLQSSLVMFPYPVSRDLIVYSAHVDTGTRKGHSNATVIFIVAKKNLFEKNMITGCGVGENIAASFHVRYVHEDNLMHQWLGNGAYLYEQLVVECYDIQVRESDRAFVLYRATNVQVAAIYTPKPVGIPKPRVTPKGHHNLSVVVCTKAHTRRVTWLPEFLRYQKTLGVDHVHLSVLDSFIKDDGFRDYLVNDSFFVDQLVKGFITVQVWNEWHKEEEWYVHGTILMYLDCLYRYRGTYDYVSFMDTDDFFTVRVPGMSYKDLIAKYCSEKSIGSCSFKWLWYYPGVCGMKKSVSANGNVTAAIVPHQGVQEQVGNLKSIHRSEAVVDSSFHDATCNTCLREGYYVSHVPEEIAYVAHHRLYVEDKFKNQVCH